MTRRRPRRAEGEQHRQLSLTPEQLQRTTQLYFSLYFTMTGLHALHMIIGIGLMSVITWMAWKGKFDDQYYTPVEMSGLYWHFVDIVWIFLFPLLYLVERHTNVGRTRTRSHGPATFPRSRCTSRFPGADGADGGDRWRGVRRPRPVQLPVAMVIACFKASLVIWYFMHVKYQSKLTKLTLSTGLFFLAILLGMMLIDYSSKEFTPLPPKVDADSQFQSH
jgi:heme/copper-type cytochrome/quinol oxidase subunit 3